MAIYARPFREEFVWYGLLDRLRGATQNQNQAFNGLIWSLCPRQGFQCQLWGGSDVFSPGVSPFLAQHSDLCVCLKNWHCELWHFTVQHLKEDDANRRKGSEWAPQMARKGEKRCWKRRGSGMRRSKRRKRVSYEPGGFSTRFVFFLEYFIAHLSSLKFFFVFSGTRNNLSLSSLNITPNMYTFLESWETWLVLKPQNSLFSRPWLHQGFWSWMTCSYRSRYPTSMTCDESCIWWESWRFMHFILPHLLEWHQLETCRFSQDIKIMSQKMSVRCRRPTKLWQATLEKWSKEINSEQKFLQDWCAATLEWKFESNRTSIDKDMLRDSPWGDLAVPILMSDLNAVVLFSQPREFCRCVIVYFLRSFTVVFVTVTTNDLMPEYQPALCLRRPIHRSEHV